MILKSTCDIEKILKGSIYFDDGDVHTYRLHAGDIATITYNNCGERDMFTGRIARIEAGTHVEHSTYGHQCQHGVVDTCDKRYWYLILDGSAYNDSNMKKIMTKDILDVEVLQKKENCELVTSPLGTTNVSGLRVIGNKLQVSMDNHCSWFTVAIIPESDIVVEPELQPIADKIENILPSCVNVVDKEKIIYQIMDAMREEGQIIVNKECDKDCCKPKDEEKPVDPDTPPTETTDEEDHKKLMEEVIQTLIAQGLICKCSDKNTGETQEPETPPTTDPEPSTPTGSGEDVKNEDVKGEV